MTARERWKIHWRAIRVSRREHQKAMRDLVIYGTGAVFVPTEGDPRHVPLDEISDKEGMIVAKWSQAK